jgi:thioredoxin 1
LFEFIIFYECARNGRKNGTIIDWVMEKTKGGAFMEPEKLESSEDFGHATQKGVCLVDFNAPWCGPCKAQAPIVDQIADDFAGRVRVLEINVSENREVAKQFGIYSIPTLVVLKNGREQERFVGMQPRETLAGALERAAEKGE